MQYGALERAAASSVAENFAGAALAGTRRGGFGIARRTGPIFAIISSPAYGAKVAEW